MGIFSKFEGKMEDTFEGAAAAMHNAPISPVQIMKKAEKQMRREKVVSAGRQYAPTLYTVLVNPDDDQRLFGFYPTLAGETETRLASSAAADGLSLDCQPLVRFIVDDALRHGKFDVIAEVVSAPIIAQLRAEEMQRYGMGGAVAAPAAAQAHAAYGNGGQAYGQPQAQGMPHQAGGAYAPANPYGNQAQPYGGEANAYNPAPHTPAYGAAAADPFAPHTPELGAFPVQADPFAASGAYPTYDVNGAAAAAKPPLPQVPENEIDYGANYGEYTFNSQNFAAHEAPDAQAGANASEARNGEAGMFAGMEPLPNENGSAAFAPAAGGAHAAAAPAATPLGNAVPAVQSAAAPVAAPIPQPAAAPVAPAPQPAYAQPQAQPNTVVFTAGAGQAKTVPDPKAARAHLIDTTANRSYDLATNRVLIGRETNNDIVVNDLNVSRQHAQIAFEPQGVWVITDLGSTNGTLVNGAMVTRRGLSSGDRITLGVTEFVFSLQ